MIPKRLAVKVVVAATFIITGVLAATPADAVTDSGPQVGTNGFTWSD